MATTLTMERDALLLPLLAAAKVAPTHTPKDILKFVRLVTAGDGELQLRATDGEISLTIALTEKPTIALDVLLPVTRLVAVLRELPAAEFELVVDQKSVNIQHGGSNFKLLAGGEPTELPTPNLEGIGADHWTIPANTLRHLLHRTAFAADTQTTRYALGGVLLSVDSPSGFMLTAAATDSRRLAVMSGDCERSGEPIFPAAGVLPLKCVKLLEAQLPDSNEPVAFHIMENAFLFRWGGHTVHGRQVEGQFPKWQNIMPEKLPVEVPLPVDPFLRAVRQSRICTSEETRGVDFKFSNGQLELSSQSADVGSSAVSLPAAAPGVSLTLTIDPKFVEDVLRAVNSGDICTVGLSDDESPCLMTFDDGFRYLVMPLAGS